MSQSQSVPAGPPYAPRVAQNGEVPTVSVDVPVLAVLLACYIAGAASNMTIFQINKRRGHKFLPSVFLFGFCMARIATMVMRIAWATRPHNVRIAIAAAIFVNAGILIIYVLNMVLAQRILRAQKPHLGWHPATKIIFSICYALVGVALVMVIVASIVALYSLSAHVHAVTRALTLASSTYQFIFTILPLFILLIAFLPPKHPNRETFGQGTLQHKVLILLGTTALCITIAGYKLGTAWMPSRALTNPAWYQSKPAFYCFLFLPEIIILCLFTPTRIDKRFHVPDGSHAPGHYSNGVAPALSKDIESRGSSEVAVAEKA